MKTFILNNQVIVFVIVLCVSGFVLTLTSLLGSSNYSYQKRYLVGKIFECDQNVKIRRDSGNTWLDCENGALVFDGDWVSNNKNSFNLQLKDGRNVFVSDASSFRIKRSEKKKIVLNLSLGRVFVRPWSNSKYKVRLKAGSEYYKLNNGADFVEVSLSKDGETELISQRIGAFTR